MLTSSTLTTIHTQKFNHARTRDFFSAWRLVISLAYSTCKPIILQIQFISYDPHRHYTLFTYLFIYRVMAKCHSARNPYIKDG